MSGIELAASIIAVITLASTVLQKAYEYGKEVKNAGQHIKRASQDISDLMEVLLKLRDLADRQKDSGRSLAGWPTLTSLQQEGGPLSQSRTALEDLSSQLAPVSGVAKVKELALWPRKAKIVEKALAMIRRQKEGIIESLNIEQA